jgi:hypothetical protein
LMLSCYIAALDARACASINLSCRQQRLQQNARSAASLLCNQYNNGID